MPYSLSWTSDRSMVTARHFAVVSIDEIKSSLVEISQQADPTMRPYILVDHREVTGFPNEAELAIFNDAHYRRPRVGHTTAFVVNEVTAEPVNFLILAGSNRGIMAKAFTDTTEAIRWLRAQGDPDA